MVIQAISITINHWLEYCNNVSQWCEQESTGQLNKPMHEISDPFYKRL